jgi:uncharacterized LabA/DUF88 family protein
VEWLTVFYQNERLALFVDGANLHGASKSLGFDIDYKRLLTEFSKRGRLIRAFYYTTLMESEEYSPLRPLIDWLDYNGFTMVTKPAKEYTDAMGRRRFKGSIDIELTVDAMEMADSVDHIVLFSGDGDFRRLVEALQRRGKRVSVVSTLKSAPPMISDDLRRQADNFIELQSLQHLIQRDPVARQQADERREARQAQSESGERRGRGTATVQQASSALDDLL